MMNAYTKAEGEEGTYIQIQFLFGGRVERWGVKDDSQVSGVDIWMSKRDHHRPRKFEGSVYVLASGTARMVEDCFSSALLLKPQSWGDGGPRSPEKLKSRVTQAPQPQKDMEKCTHLPVNAFPR